MSRGDFLFNSSGYQSGKVDALEVINMHYFIPASSVDYNELTQTSIFLRKNKV